MLHLCGTFYIAKADVFNAAEAMTKQDANIVTLSYKCMQYSIYKAIVHTIMELVYMGTM